MESSAPQEARVYLQELDTHLHVKWLEDSPSVLSLGRLCDDFIVFIVLSDSGVVAHAAVTATLPVPDCL